MQFFDFLSGIHCLFLKPTLQIKSFCSDLYQLGSDLIFLKRQRFLYCPITDISGLTPIAFVAATPVMLILLCLSPQYLLDIMQKVLFGEHL